MDAQVGKVKREMLEVQRNTLRWIVASLIALCVVMAGLMAYILTLQQIVVIPMGSNKPYAVGRGHADKDYLTDYAFDVVSLWGNVNPENIDFNTARILKLCDSVGNSKVRLELQAASKKIKAEFISTVWSPIDADVNMNKKSVIVRGMLRTYINNILTTNSEKKMIVEFDIASSGQVHVTNLKEYVAPIEPK
jgi:conjugal transfer pilus assembly protein TraE